jgi:hypothetical protein
VGEWLLRKLQRKAARRTVERRNLLHIERGADPDRNLAAALQQGAATLVAGIPTGGTRGNRLAGKTRSANVSAKLTFLTDHSAGAGHRDLQLDRSEQRHDAAARFIAQQVQTIFPNLVSTTSATALTPDGTLSLNYIDLVSPIVSAIQALSSEMSSIESTIAGFANSFATNQLTFVRGQGTEIDVQTANVQTLCIGSTCITEAQLQALLAAAGHAGATNTDSSGSASGTSQTISTHPVIQINGDNPAVVQVNATYNDLGATITGPQDDLSLGIQTFVNGALMSPVLIDTSIAATDTIDYVVTDQSGLTSTSTRTVIVEAAAQSPVASSTAATSTSD